MQMSNIAYYEITNKKQIKKEINQSFKRTRKKSKEIHGFKDFELMLSRIIKEHAKNTQIAKYIWTIAFIKFRNNQLYEFNKLKNSLIKNETKKYWDSYFR